MMRWRSTTARGALGQVWAAVFGEGNLNEVCGQPDPVEPLGQCARAPHHPGRHIAVGLQGEVFAAWPGDHEPTLADLEA